MTKKLTDEQKKRRAEQRQREADRKRERDDLVRWANSREASE